MLHSQSLIVTEASQVGQARRCATKLAESVGLDAELVGKVALAATEVSNNLHLHGGGGELLIRALDDRGAGGVELLAIDRGPGMADFEQCLRDGYSTRGTAGQGLGAMSRAAHEFELHTQPGVGTVIMLRFWSRVPGPDGSGLVSSGVNVPAPNEEVSGDAFACEHGKGISRFIVVDGLGHGTGAATAAVESIKTFHEERSPDPAWMIRTAHDRIRHTRGAAMAVAVVDRDARLIRYAGIGNIVSLVVAPGGRRTNMVSMNGTVGHALRQVQEFTYPFPEGALLVMHSDGIGPQWHLESYPGLVARHPSVIAGVLYRDFRRQRDDSSVLVVRQEGGLG